MELTRTTLVGALAAVALSGCGDEPKPPGDPKPEGPEAVLNHYLCYDVKPEGFEGKKGVEVKDQFRRNPRPVAVMRRDMLCNPVDKNGKKAPRAGAHLVCYLMKDELPDRPTLDFSNQFDQIQRGAQRYRVVRPSTLCLPSGKTKDVEGGPPPIPGDVDHFTCYVVALDGEFRRFDVGLKDQFVSTNLDDQPRAEQAERFCNPAEKRVDGKPKSGPPKNAEAHLLCYRLSLPIDPPEVLIANQFEPKQKVEVGAAANLLCVPSKKRVVRP